MPAPSYPLGHKIKSTPAAVLAQALAAGVVLSAAGGKLHAAGDRASIEALAPLVHQHRDELVQLLSMPDPASTPASPEPHGADAAPPPPPPPPPAPLPWLSVHQPWRAADRLYEAHHWQCPVCCAAARCRYTERCVEGQRLHDAYTLASSAALNERTSP